MSDISKNTKKIEEYKYELVILSNGGEELLKTKYKTQGDISKALKIPRHTINRIFLNKYTYDKKKNTNPKLKNYRINKLKIQ